MNSVTLLYDIQPHVGPKLMFVTVHYSMARCLFDVRTKQQIHRISCSALDGQVESPLHFVRDSIKMALKLFPYINKKTFLRRKINIKI